METQLCLCDRVLVYISGKLKMWQWGPAGRGGAHTICSHWPKYCVCMCIPSSSWRLMLFVFLYKHPPVDCGNIGRDPALGSAGECTAEIKNAHSCSVQHSDSHTSFTWEAKAEIKRVCFLLISAVLVMSVSETCHQGVYYFLICYSWKPETRITAQNNDLQSFCCFVLPVFYYYQYIITCMILIETPRFPV